MRKIVLNVAVTLDGFIEGPNGEYDWCFIDQDYGLSDFFKRVDTVFMGRKSYELVVSMGDKSGLPPLKEYVFSTTLEKVREGATLLKENIKEEVERIKNEEGKDIWLYGGSALTTSLFNLGLVDEISLAIHPLLLGSGKPLFANLNDQLHLECMDNKTYSTGLVILTYGIIKK